MTTLGLGSYGVAWSIGVPGYPAPPHPLDAHGVLRLAADHGLRLVQLADNLALHTLPPAAHTAIAMDAARRRITVELGARGSQPDPLRAHIALCRVYSARLLRVVVDAPADHPAPEEVVARLRALLPDLAAAHVTLAVENHDRFPAATLHDIIAAVDDPHVGICLDTVNSFGSLEGPAAVVGLLAPHVVNLHIKDFTVRRAPHSMGFTISGAPAGAGMLDVPWLLAELAAHARPFNALIEQWPPPQPTPEATAAHELAWLAQSVTTLRAHIPA